MAKTIIEYYGGKVTKSLSGKTDIIVVSRKMKRDKFNRNNVKRAKEDYERYCNGETAWKNNIIDKDAKRIKKNKPEIRVIFEDDFYVWLQSKYNELKSSTDLFRPYGIISIFLCPADKLSGRYVFKFKSDSFADIPKDRLEEATKDINSISDFISNIEKFTKKGAFADSQTNSHEYSLLMQMDENYKLNDYVDLIFVYESSSGTKYKYKM